MVSFLFFFFFVFYFFVFFLQRYQFSYNLTNDINNTILVPIIKIKVCFRVHSNRNINYFFIFLAKMIKQFVHPVPRKRNDMTSRSNCVPNNFIKESGNRLCVKNLSMAQNYCVGKSVIIHGGGSAKCMKGVRWGGSKTPKMV